MKSCVLGLLLLLLSLHACSARPLGFGGTHAGNNQDLMKISSSPELSLINKAENKLNQLLTMMRDSKAYEVQEEYTIESDEVTKTTFQASQRRGVPIDVEKWKKDARRSTLQSLSHHNNNAKPEETMNSLNQNEGHDEEAVVMDYAQPHRKPPIHNKEP